MTVFFIEPGIQFVRPTSDAELLMRQTIVLFGIIIAALVMAALVIYNEYEKRREK